MATTAISAIRPGRYAALLPWWSPGSQIRRTATCSLFAV
jgi:hypothetical protein